MAVAGVRWLRTALRSLDEIVVFVALDKPAAARALADRIRTTVGLLARQPRLGKPGRLPGVRELVIAGTPYIVFYRERRGQIEILRIRHGALRRPESP